VVEWRREDSEGSTWLEASHDGYREPLGVIHRRRLFLGAGGDDLRGEDRLDGAKDGHFAIRFHLHPEVQVSLVQSGGAALLRLPKGGGWRFMARGAQMSLEPSVYLGDESQSRRSEQIVLSPGRRKSVPAQRTDRAVRPSRRRYLRELGPAARS
jgi:uncharacterized heparinase superfamily protein